LRRYRNVPAVPVDVERSYSAALTSVLVKTYALPKEQWVEIALTPAAHEALISFAEWVEPQLHEETGDLRHTGEFAGKLAGNTARMATLMGLAENARMLTPWTVPVSESNMQRAISIARYLIPHAASLCEGPDPTRPKAQSVWQLLKADGRSHITKTDIWQLSRGRFAQIGGLEAVLDLLCRHGFLREREGQRAPGLSNRGRKPCPVYEVNPNATGMEV
jgi:hypothetical protein